MKRMSKINLKSFILGFLVCSIITTMCVPALASNISKTITAYYNNIKIYVDDSVVTPTDANGNVVEPFIYNGTTYLPVRAVANALGKDVNWDGNTSSVYIGTHNTPSTNTPSTNTPSIDTPIISVSNNNIVSKMYNGWSANMPFTVNGNNVNSETTGISFAGNPTKTNYVIPYATFKIDNSKGRPYLLFQIAKDDNFAGNFKYGFVGQSLAGSYRWYKYSELATEQVLSNGFKEVTVDISKLKSISVYFVPNVSGEITINSVDNNGVPIFNAKEMNSLSPFYIYDTYMLLRDIFVSPF